jgi:tRNA A37 threonylcarbamoyladenosine biosynthesis protein TsaE
VLFLNTASTFAMIRHYSEDKSAIYGTDIYYLDQIRKARQHKGATE